MNYINKNINSNFKKSVFISVLIFSEIYFFQSHSAYAKDILIFAASSLTLPLKKITNSYHEKTSNRVRISFAASSTLAQQISRGAPADIFISANKRWLDFLAKNNNTITRSRRKILSNRLVIISPIEHSLEISDLNMLSVKNIVKDGLLGIGNPDHVPLGIYSKQALNHLNLWKHIKKNLARLTNARAVLTFVERGETKTGIVYKSDTHLNKKVKIVFEFPQETHNPIDYFAALTRSRSPNTSIEFFNTLFNQESKNIFKQHGFLVE